MLSMKLFSFPLQSSPLSISTFPVFWYMTWCLAQNSFLTKSCWVCCFFSHSVVSNSLWPMDFNPPGSSIHGVLQARILEWVAIPFSRRSSQPRDRTSCIVGRFFTIWATRESQILSSQKTSNSLYVFTELYINISCNQFLHATMNKCKFRCKKMSLKRGRIPGKVLHFMCWRRLILYNSVGSIYIKQVNDRHIYTWNQWFFF